MTKLKKQVDRLLDDGTSSSFDLLITHNQICLRSKKYEESDHIWGNGNIEQGFLLYPNVIVADTLVEAAFGANVTVEISEKYTENPYRQRAAAIPILVDEGGELTIYSASEEFKISTKPQVGQYQVYFEVCIKEEVFYKFTIVECKKPVCMALMSDGWGLEKDKHLQTGKF